MTVRRQSQESHDTLVFLLDTMTNVVGILVIVLMITQTEVASVVKDVRKRDLGRAGARESVAPTQEMLDAANGERDRLKALVDAAELRWGELEPATRTAKDDLEKTLERLDELDREVHEALASEAKVAEADRDVVAKLVQEKQTSFDALSKRRDEIKASLDAMPPAPPPKTVTLPNPRPPPVGKKLISFMCTDGRLLPFNDDQLAEAFKKAVDDFARTHRSGPSAAIAYFDEHEVGDEFFRIRFEAAFGSLIIRFDARKATVGHPVDTPQQSIDRFKALVERKDPKEVWIDFLVNGDSFAAYLKARELAEDRDFEVGWEPLTGPLKQRLDANSSGGPKRGPE